MLAGVMVWCTRTRAPVSVRAGCDAPRTSWVLSIERLGVRSFEQGLSLWAIVSSHHPAWPVCIRMHHERTTCGETPVLDSMSVWLGSSFYDCIGENIPEWGVSTVNSKTVRLPVKLVKSDKKIRWLVGLNYLWLNCDTPGWQGLTGKCIKHIYTLSETLPLSPRKE